MTLAGLRRLALAAAVALTGCFDLGADYTACVAAGRCTDDAGRRPDAGPVDAGAPDAGAPDAGLDGGAGIDAGRWVDLTPRKPDGGAIGSHLPFTPDLVNGAGGELLLAYRQLAMEAVPGESATTFAVRRYPGVDGGWELDPALSGRMNTAGLGLVPIPLLQSVDAPFDRVVVAQTGSATFFAKDLWGGGNGETRTQHFTGSAEVITSQAHSGLAIAARNAEGWLALRRCDGGDPVTATIAVIRVGSAPSSADVVATGNRVAMGPAPGECLPLQAPAFDVGLGAPGLAIDNNGLQVVAFAGPLADGGFLADGGLAFVARQRVMGATSWSPMPGADGLTNAPLGSESVTALAPISGGVLLAFSDRATTGWRLRVFKRTLLMPTEVGLPGSSVVAFTPLTQSALYFTWDAVRGIALGQVGARTWLAMTVHNAAALGTHVFVVSIGPGESGWTFHPGPGLYGQLDDGACDEPSMPRLAQRDGAPVVAFAQICGTRTHLVVWWLR